MSNGKLEQNVRAKFFQDFEQSADRDGQGKASSTSAAVNAMLIGFILEGDEPALEPHVQATINEQDWFYKL